MNIEERIAQALDSAYPMSRESAIDALVPLVKRAQAEAWKRAKREIKGIPHWFSAERGYGEFDLQPLGPDATSEHGAFMAVMEALAHNPYTENEGAPE